MKEVSLIFFLLLPLWGSAQYRLILLKRDNTIFSFKEGDYIRFKRKDRNHFTRGFIAGIHQDYFRIGEDTTYTHQLQKIDLTDLPNSGFRTASIGKGLIAAGLMIFLGDLVNTTLVRDDPYTVHSGVLISSALLVGAGTAMQVVNNDYFVLGRKKKAVIVDW
ncbi:MAG: hypothetical protein HRU69_07100 [Flammeovirgaceae bacterium]|nr:MAG: hypothetical protein HRU69_07100 [Flammeovirgaceae bacterium]